MGMLLSNIMKCHVTRLLGLTKFNVDDSVNTGKSSKLGRHGFGSLHNITWTCYHNEGIPPEELSNAIDHFEITNAKSFGQDKMHNY